MVLMWTWGKGEEAVLGEGLGWWEDTPWSHPLSTHLSVGLCEQLDDTGMRSGHHAVSIDLNDAVPHTHAPALSNATTE